MTDIIEGEEVKLAWPTVFTTVDIGVYHMPSGSWLLGRKPHQRFRFPGGFMDVTDPSYAHAAQRELLEETTLTIPVENFWKIGDFPIDDSRYKDTPHRIQTNLFVVQWYGDRDLAVADDDLVDVTWTSGQWLAQSYKELLVPIHCILWEQIVRYYSEDDSWYG